MPKVALVILLLAPFVAWDAAGYLLRARGDTSPGRRAEILLHFEERDIAAGREHVVRHNRLFPFYRIIFYAFYSALLFGGLAGWLESRLLPLVGGRWYCALPLFLLTINLTLSLLYLPFSVYREFVIEKQAGLSTITAATFVLDRIKGLGLNLVIETIVALPVIWLVRTQPAWWPLPAWVVILAISAFGIWISPWVIDPLFNKFTPLENRELGDGIRSLSSRAGLTVENVYVMDASRRSLYLNAYFTGLGNSRRVVLYDTLVKECSEGEVLSVVAHELGHWKWHHIRKGFALMTLSVFAGLWLFWWLLNWEAGRSFFGLPEPGSLVLLALLPFLISLGGTLVSPVASAISRHFERQADSASLELTADPAAFISLEVKLVRQAQSDLLSPRLLHDFYGSHPLPEERIRMAEGFAAATPPR
ncbi:MAG TPA: M48 family metallopeptidase [Candidatus Glassbacteria bacterium]|nr:M48 family metallopeptidase [Candidatus Glassbacteria bacterium]